MTFDEELNQIERNITQDNAGIMSVRLEYLCRMHPVFRKWKGLCNKASEIAWTVYCKQDAKGRLLDSIMIIQIELKRRRRAMVTRTVTKVTGKM